METSIKVLPVLLGLVAVLWGCDSDKDLQTIDSGRPETEVKFIDGGVVLIDGGSVGIDGGLSEIDGGVVTIDGGLSEIDGSVVLIDGGSIEIDGGVVTIDGGVCGIDGGAVGIDGGVVTIDGGAFTDALTSNPPSEFTVTSTSMNLTVSSGNTLGISNQDDSAEAISVGFDFTFLRTSYSTIYASTNGFVSFASTGNNTWTNTALPDQSSPNALIALWWDALNPSAGGTITTTLTGTNPNRVRSISYINVVRSFGGTQGITMEIRLHETNNVIEVHYGLMTTGGYWAASAGWENVDGTSGWDLLGCAPSCHRWKWPTNTIYTYTPTP